MKLTRTTRNAGWLVVAGLLGAALIAPAGAAANGTVWATVTGHVASSTGTPNPNQVAYWLALGYEDCTKIDIHTYNDPDKNQEIASYLLATSYDLVVVKAETGEFANTLFENATAGESVFADTNGSFDSDPRSEGFEDGDHNISHIIFCDPVQTTTTTTTTDETTTTTDETTTTTDETTTTTDETTTTTDETTTTTDETTTTTDETTTTTDETTTTTDETTTTTDETTTTTTSSVDTVTTTSVTGTISGETGEPTPPSTDTVAFSSTSSTTGNGWGLILVALAGFLAAALLLTPAAVRKR